MNAKREKGMSAKVWEDLVSSMCDATQCTDPQMRYQYYFAGLWNKRWKAALSTSTVNKIPQAVAVLLYKSTHIPNEDDAEYVDETNRKPVPENATTQQMATMQQTHNLLSQQQQ
ncbi:hypothetical protein PC128_g6740 [Phytophthora cactorum]|nr:hypothetical protein PC128_g6740 [Phytophthora cactorum]